MKNYVLITTLAISSLACYGQNVGINETGNVADPSAILDIESENKGLLIPRVNLLNRTDVTTIPTPAPSLLVHNDNTAGTGINAVSPGYYYWDGSIWVRIGATGDYWETDGNAGTIASTAPIDLPTTDNFIGTTDNQDFVVSTNGFERMRVKTNNNQTIRVGIGTAFAPSFPVSAGNTSTLLHLYDGGTTSSDFAQLQLGSAHTSATNKVGAIDFHSALAITDRRTAGIESFLRAVNGSGDVRIYTNNSGVYSEKVRIQPNGRVGIGNTTPGGQLEVAQEVNAPTAIFGNYGNINELFLRRSQGSLTSPTNNGNGSSLARLIFQGYNGAYLDAARIESNIDGVPNASSMPGRLVFSTTPNGSTNVAEAMRINRDQNIRIGSPNASTTDPIVNDADNIRLDVQNGFVRLGSYNNDPGINAAGPARSFANGVGALAIGMNRNPGRSNVDFWNTTSNTQLAANGTNDRGFDWRRYNNDGNEEHVMGLRGDGLLSLMPNNNTTEGGQLALNNPGNNISGTDLNAWNIDNNTNLTEGTNNALRFYYNGNNIPSLIAPEHNNGEAQIGVNMVSQPNATLDVNGSIKTSYSGTTVLSPVNGIQTLTLTIPAVDPSLVGVTNSVVMVHVSDGVPGNVRMARLISTTQIELNFVSAGGGNTRFNYVIFKL